MAEIFLKPNHPSKRLWISCSIAFLVSNSLLTLPIHYLVFKFMGKTWNWSGKIYATIGSGLIYFIFKKDFKQTDLITLDQQPNSLPANLLLMLVILTANTMSAWLVGSKQAFNIEALAYQLTMPGIEEELLFRGILLSLLATMYPKPIGGKRWTMGYPSIWLTATLFGLVHGLQLTNNWFLTMNWAYFGSTFLPGWLFGWMALRSRSMLLPTLTHNLANFCLTLISMIK